MKDTDLLLTGGERRAAWVASGEKPPTFPDACPDDDFARRLCRAQAAKVLAVLARRLYAIEPEHTGRGWCHDASHWLALLAAETGLPWPKGDA